ncbi:MAG: class I SAM-dependent methyltransferase [Candidatus Rokuibacteriota bacterium]
MKRTDATAFTHRGSLCVDLPRLVFDEFYSFEVGRAPGVRRNKRENMQTAAIRTYWEGAAPGWARWEPTIAAWMEPATEALLTMAGVGAGARVLDLASGAGSQTLRAAQRVGVQGHVVACDIADTMLRHVRENARAAGLTHVTTLAGAAEDLDVAAESFDAVISRLALMLFCDPARALRAVRRALRPGGKVAVVVFTTPAANPFMAEPMQILLRHAGKTPPASGQPGIFALGAPGAIERLFADSGFVDIERRTVALALRMPSAAEALAMMQEAFGAYRAVVGDCPEAVRLAAWADVGATLRTFETATGFVAPAEVLVAAGARPA